MRVDVLSSPWSALQCVRPCPFYFLTGFYFYGVFIIKKLVYRTNKVLSPHSPHATQPSEVASMTVWLNSHIHHQKMQYQQKTPKPKKGFYALLYTSMNVIGSQMDYVCGWAKARGLLYHHVKYKTGFCVWIRYILNDARIRVKRYPERKLEKLSSLTQSVLEGCRQPLELLLLHKNDPTVKNMMMIFHPSINCTIGWLVRRIGKGKRRNVIHPVINAHNSI